MKDNDKLASELVRGAIDFHVHAGPDPLRVRRYDALELARVAQAAGLRAVVIKNHYCATATLAYAATQAVSGITVIGSLVLNSAVGGLNAEAVEVALRLGARVVWMPTYSSVIDTGRRRSGQNPMPVTDQAADHPGITLLDDGRLRPEVLTILDIIKKAGAVLATGHISVPEIYALVEAAREIGVKVVITHPLNVSYGVKLSLAEQRDLAGRGAYLEHCYRDCLPDVPQPLDIGVMAEHIRAVGAARCILSSDLGQSQNPPPPEGLRTMLIGLSRAGLTEDELRLMVQTNPAHLLGLA